uniref:Uncharacterized protein n=2 Tax=Arundinoideae TaxID=156631 RepID=A0A0A9KDC8_ARUDO
MEFKAHLKSKAGLSD